MSTADSKRTLIEEQAHAKIYWGASKAEVTAWLTEEKGVPESDAEQILQNALRARSTTIRRRAIMTLLISAVGVLIGTGMTVLWWQGHMRRAWYLAVAIGTPSLALFLKSIANLVSGDSDEPLE